MTIAVAVKTESALVFAADSKVTTRGVAGLNPDGTPNWVEQTYDNATKVAHDRNRLLMAMVAGHANVGPSAATDFIQRQAIPLVDSPATQDQQIGELVEKMAKLNEEHWSKTPVPKDQWPGPTILLGLPSTADGAGPRLWRVTLEHAQKTTSEALSGQRGIWLEGAFAEVYTLLYGYHPGILDAVAKTVGIDLTAVAQKTTSLGVLRPIDKLSSVPGMPIQDAVDLAVFLAKVQVEMDRFLPDTPACGGPIDVMILQMAPDPGISFLPGKRLHHPGQAE
jgi:hypothetical protein